MGLVLYTLSLVRSVAGAVGRFVTGPGCRPIRRPVAGLIGERISKQALQLASVARPNGLKLYFGRRYGIRLSKWIYYIWMSSVNLTPVMIFQILAVILVKRSAVETD